MAARGFTTCLTCSCPWGVALSDTRRRAGVGSLSGRLHLAALSFWVPLCISAEERTDLCSQCWLEAGQGLGSGRSACGGAAAAVSLLQAPEPAPRVSCHSFSGALAGSRCLTLMFPLPSRELHTAFQGEEQTLRRVWLLAERNQPDIRQPAPHRADNLLLRALAEQRFPGEGPLFWLCRPGSFLLLLGEEEPRRWEM